MLLCAALVLLPEATTESVAVWISISLSTVARRTLDVVLAPTARYFPSLKLDIVISDENFKSCP